MEGQGWHLFEKVSYMTIQKAQLNTFATNNAVSASTFINTQRQNSPNSLFGLSSSINDYSNDIMCKNLSFTSSPQINQSCDSLQPSEKTDEETQTENPQNNNTNQTKPKEILPKFTGKMQYIGAGTGFLLPTIPKFIEVTKGAKFKDVFKLKSLALPAITLSLSGFIIGKLTDNCLKNRNNNGSTP